ncbi:MAG: hypothetical protein GY722_12545 [bacterium]|nr:hypothetical protein [bacterium]
MMLLAMVVLIAASACAAEEPVELPVPQSSSTEPISLVVTQDGPVDVSENDVIRVAWSGVTVTVIDGVSAGGGRTAYGQSHWTWFDLFEVSGSSIDDDGNLTLYFAIRD